MKLHNSKALLLPLFFAATGQTVLARINTPSSVYEVYGVNTCGYGVNPYNKTDIDVHFYLADDDIVQANLRKGECYHFGQTTKEQPEYSTEGEGIDIQPTKWPDAFMCKDLGKEAGEMIQQELNLCVGVEFPENACVVDVC